MTMVSLVTLSVRGTRYAHTIKNPAGVAFTVRDKYSAYKLYITEESYPAWTVELFLFPDVHRARLQKLTEVSTYRIYHSGEIALIGDRNINTSRTLRCGFSPHVSRFPYFYLRTQHDNSSRYCHSARISFGKHQILIRKKTETQFEMDGIFHGKQHNLFTV